LQNLNITAALSSAICGSTTSDNWGMQNVVMVNTQNNASARCVQGDNAFFLNNCDISCTGAAHGSVIDCDVTPSIMYCRIKTTSTSSHITTDPGIFSGNVFFGNSSSIAIQLLSASTPSQVFENTFYNIGTCVQLPNVSANQTIFVNNYATGCSKMIDSLYVGTANNFAVVGNNRTRSVTTIYTGIEPIEFGAVTTAGSDAADYVNAAADNFNLLSTAPGVSVAMRQYRSMGALQRDQTGGGGGGGMRLAGHGGLAA
jgi:hypothetical protein